MRLPTFNKLNSSDPRDHLREEFPIKFANPRPGKTSGIFNARLPLRLAGSLCQFQASRNVHRIAGIDQVFPAAYYPLQPRRVMGNDRQTTSHGLEDISERFLFGQMQKDIRGTIECRHLRGTERQSCEPARQSARSKLIRGLSERPIARDDEMRVG
jgi:hypothetical protein